MQDDDDGGEDDVWIEALRKEKATCATTQPQHDGGSASVWTERGSRTQALMSVRQLLHTRTIWKGCNVPDVKLSKC